MFQGDLEPPPPVAYVEKPNDEDFECPPLPPPPSEEDLASYSAQSPSSSNADSPPPSTIISPTYKAQTNFRVWTPGSSVKTNGVSTEDKSDDAKFSGPTGFRSVARPITKKSGQGPAKSTTTTRGFPLPSENVRVTSQKDLPEGAVYETQTIEGNVLHTDTYYPAPGEEKILERTKKTTIIRAEHHDGMGPTDEQGLPVALRSTVENQKAWYKNMFKQIHKVENEGDEQKSDADSHDYQDERPVVSQTPMYKPKKLGRITDYTPSDPYVVENKPAEKIPPASTSHKSHWQDKPKQRSNVELVHGTDYSLKDTFTMADHVVMEPKHVVTIHPTKQQKEEEVTQKKRQPAKAKFNFVAQTNKQMTLMKDQIVIITRDVNKDWYEGQTPDGKHSGMFPVAYVEIMNPAASKPLRRGRARAKFDFNATDPKQLPVKKGDIVELIEKVDANWYKGSVGQKSGILPANYLEVEREPEQKSKAAGSSPNISTNQTPVNAKPQKTSSYNHSATISSSSSNSEPDDKEKMSKASFLANAVVSGGVNLHKPHGRRGEFDIPELDDEAMGISHGVNGKHASQGSYDTTLSTTSSSLHSDLGQNLHISNKPTRVPSSASSSHSEQQLETKESPEQKETNETLDDGFPVQEKHVALYPYVPQNEDELELRGGDIVQVVEKCDDGWFVGSCERTGAFGTFPGNYVVACD